MKKRRILFALYLIFFSINALSQSAANFLQQSYQNNSTSQLKQFFEYWSKDINSIDTISFSKLNDTLKQTYNVFTAFYKPLDIKNLGGSEWGNDIYSKVSYLLVQNSVAVYFTDKIYYSNQEIDSTVVTTITQYWKPGDTSARHWLKRINGKLSVDAIQRFGPDSHSNLRKDKLYKKVKNFKPVINSEGKIPLYLNTNYDSVLNTFLGNKSLKLGAGNIMNPAKSVGESNKRKLFLENFIKIWYGHWGGYWQLNSYPIADAIIFDKDMKYAQVRFRMVYEGGEAILKNNNGHWKLLSSKITWIE